MKLQQLYTPLFILSIVMVIVVGIIINRFRSRIWIVLIGVMLVGGVYFINHPLNKQVEQVLGENQQIIATVKETRENSYGTTYILKEIGVLQEELIFDLHFRLQGYSKAQHQYQIGDRLLISGNIEQLPLQYNPSDMDYGLYLKGEGIGAVIQMEDITFVENHSSSINIGANYLKSYISTIFQDRDNGMINSLILGDKTDLDVELKELYNTLGIGHILAISGLHVGILYGILWWITGKLQINYALRNIVIAIILWIYCMISGFSVSAIRATSIVTLIIIAKLLWEELDLWIGISWISLFMVIRQPYIIYQVGYQLSFMAYIALILWREIIKSMKYIYRVNKKILGVTKYAGSSIWISLWISPILAYHFYEIPIIASLMNLFILAFMESMIPLIMIALILGYGLMDLAIQLAGGICLGLDLVTWVGERVVLLPLATKVVGQPRIVSILSYYIVLVILTWLIIYNMWYKVKQYATIFVIPIGIFLLADNENSLQIAQLYVAQGDAAVMITPQEHVVVIDGGAKGKGSVVRQFIHYKGYDTIDLAIVSHPHEDHIAGIVELIEENIPIKSVMMPFVADNEWAQRLEDLCYKKHIPLYRLKQGNRVDLDKVKLTCLGPEENSTSDDLNGLSAVVLVEYESFEALYTGDLPVEQEYEMIPYLDDIDILKVGHHGSYTSTSDKLLQQTLPEYGMISCSENNRYNHPSPMVVERLKAYGTEVLKTYEQGAIMIETDGMNLSIDTHIGG